MAHTRVYCKGVLEAEGFPVADVSDHLERPDTVVWVDLCGPSLDQLHELADELGLHELAVEDALGPHQRPKIDRYATHAFLACHSVRVNVEKGELAETEIDAFITKRWLITVRKDEQFAMEPVLERWDHSPDLAVHGVGFLLYGLLDVVVDGYFDAERALDEYYDEISEGMFSENPLEPAQQRHWFEMRRSLVRFHRLVMPMRETVSGLMRREHPAIAGRAVPLLPGRVRPRPAGQRVDRRPAGSRGHHRRGQPQPCGTTAPNQIMKKVTSWAAIIAVPTLITGYYGANPRRPGGRPDVGRRPVGCADDPTHDDTLDRLYIVAKKMDWL